jgi:hypothetical protein
MSEIIEVGPPEPRREAKLYDTEVLVIGNELGLRVWLRQKGFDLSRPIQRHRIEMESCDMFVQYQETRRSIHNFQP